MQIVVLFSKFSASYLQEYLYTGNDNYIQVFALASLAQLLVLFELARFAHSVYGYK